MTTTDVPIRSADDLTTRWTGLLNPPVFTARSLWLCWFGTDGRMLPAVVPVDDLPLVPDPALLMGLRQVHDSILEEQLGGNGHLALALCPAGTAGDHRGRRVGRGPPRDPGRGSDRRLVEPAPRRGRTGGPARRGAAPRLASLARDSG